MSWKEDKEDEEHKDRPARTMAPRQRWVLRALAPLVQAL